ncbi:MAG: RNA methyltransferase [Chlorobi bacterium]|nr:RNA methyltransferase [Chlorobiota bacterium]
MRKLKTNELGRKSIEEFKKADKIPVAIISDNIRSMNNIGSFFRTSDAFLIEKIYLCGITPRPPHNDIRKTALGADKSVDWEYFENTEDAIKILKDKGYLIISVEQAEGSIMLNKFNINTNKKYALVFGNEVKGVQQKIIDISDFCIEIPQEGTKHSLNVSVSGGIVIWEFYRKFKTTD